MEGAGIHHNPTPGPAELVVWAIRLLRFLGKTIWIVADKQGYTVYAFSEGLAVVRTKMTTGIYGMGDSWGYIDKTGKYRIEPRFNQADSLEEGLAWVHLGGDLHKVSEGGSYREGGEWRLIDSTGRTLKKCSKRFPWDGRR